MTFPRLLAGSGAPALRLDLNIGGLFGLPAASSVPRGSEEQVYRAAVDAGIRGFQTNRPDLCRALGVAASHWGRVDTPAQAEDLARHLAQEGYTCASVHVGTEYTDDLPALRLLDACVAASARHGVCLFVETHRATVTQDPWRTLGFVRAIPELRFNADLSHWYTGTEMPYGDLTAKFDRLMPVLERCRFIHGRIGTAGCIQVGVEGGEDHAGHFRELWTRIFRAFRREAVPGEVFPFTPELLGPGIHYARTVRQPDGSLAEETDRWQQAFVLWRIAQEAWAAAAPDHTGPR